MTHFYPNPKTSATGGGSDGIMLAAKTPKDEVQLGVQMAANRVVKLGDSMNKPTVKFLLTDPKPIVKLGEIWGAKPKAFFTSVGPKPPTKILFGINMSGKLSEDYGM